MNKSIPIEGTGTTVHNAGCGRHTALVAVLSLMLCSTAHAQVIVNGSFELGSSGWQTIGNVSFANSSVGVAPPDGSQHAFLKSETGTPNLENLELFLFGENSDVLDLLGAHQGAAIKQDITAAVGDVLRVSWDFLTLEDAGSPPAQNDFAFVSLGSGNIFLIAEALGDTPAGSPTPTIGAPSGTGFQLHTGYRNFEFVFNTPGTYTLGFAVMDAIDSNQGSGLLLDQISVVPEPWAYSTATAASLLLLAVGRRLVPPRTKQL